jgi:squalene-hopene/tetraprenyl-beta-curcumene cyclase
MERPSTPFWIALALTPLLALPSAAQEAALPVRVSESQVRKAVERSLPFLEKEGVGWIQKHDCLSCHHVPFMLWSHQEARGRGFELDEKKLAGWADWSLGESTAQRVRLKLTDPSLEALKGEALPAETLAKLSPLAKKPGSKEGAFLKELAKVLSADELRTHQAALLKHASREKGDGGGLDTMGQLLLAGAYASEGSRETDFVASTRLRIAELQQADGSWKAGGQLPRMNRSEAEGTDLTTGWMVLALSEKPDLKSKEGIDRARVFLKSGKPGKTNESLLVRLLVEEKFGEAGASQALLKELLGRQNPDGGWAWLNGGTSDAFATGQVLYALSVSGVAGDDAALQRARKHLIETQGEDGSWALPPPALTSPDTKPERIARLEPIYRYWGSAWATIGLVRTLPAKSP